MNKRLIPILALIVQGLFLFSACEGPAGPTGPEGPAYSSSFSPLAQNVWTGGTFTMTDGFHWYTFEAEAAKSYAVRVNEQGGLNHGDGTKTAGVSLGVYTANYKDLVDSSINGKYVMPGAAAFSGYAGTVYIYAGQNGPPGTYAITYTEYAPADYPLGFAPRNLVAAIPDWGDSWYPVISWESVPGATGYRVYRSSSGGGTYTQIGSDIPSGSGRVLYTDSGASTNTYYYYKVSAFNTHGEGPQSGYKSLSTPNAAPGGSAPSGTATALSDNVWAEGNLASGSSVDWYTFTAVPGTTYRIQANDSYGGNGTKTVDMVFSVYTSDGTPLLYRIDDSSYADPVVLENVSGAVYIRVFPYLSGSGTYAIRYFTE